MTTVVYEVPLDVAKGLRTGAPVFINGQLCDMQSFSEKTGSDSANKALITVIVVPRIDGLVVPSES